MAETFKVEKEKQAVDSHKLTIPIRQPLVVDDKEVTELTLDFTNLTGADILSIDKELRLEGHHAGFDNIFNQEVLIKLASRTTGVLPDELRKMHAADFLEMTLQVRNFFIRW